MAKTQEPSKIKKKNVQAQLSNLSTEFVVDSSDEDAAPGYHAVKEVNKTTTVPKEKSKPVKAVAKEGKKGLSSSAHDSSSTHEIPKVKTGSKSKDVKNAKVKKVRIVPQKRAAKSESSSSEEDSSSEEEESSVQELQMSKKSATTTEQQKESDSSSSEDTSSSEEETLPVKKSDKSTKSPIEVSSGDSSEETSSSEEVSSEAESSSQEEPATSVPSKPSTKVNGVKRKASGQSSSSSSPTDSSSDEPSSEPVPKKSKSQSKPAPSSSSSSAPQQPTQPTTKISYQPPPGYHPTPSTLHPLLNPTSLPGKQIWHILCPASIPLEALLPQQSVLSTTNLQHNGRHYDLIEKPYDGSHTIFLPSRQAGEDDTVVYEKGKGVGIGRVLRVEQRVTIPGGRAGKKREGEGRRAQPGGLRMRYRPPGYGVGRMGRIGTPPDGSEEEEVVRVRVDPKTSRKRFKTPGVVVAAGEKGDAVGGADVEGGGKKGKKRNGVVEGNEDVEMEDAPVREKKEKKAKRNKEVAEEAEESPKKKKSKKLVEDTDMQDTPAKQKNEKKEKKKRKEVEVSS